MDPATQPTGSASMPWGRPTALATRPRGNGCRRMERARHPPTSGGVTGGTVHLVVPTTAGQYEVRFFVNNSFNVIAKSAAITATGAAPPPPPSPPNSPPNSPNVQINGSSNPVTVAGGAAIAATVSN